MASSTVPLSLLAKGIGQVVTNGHEKLEVYLEPEDYYNLKSYSPLYQFDPLHETGRPLEVGDAVIKPIPLHKTFVTRKGALLIFSEELANKAFAEEAQKLKLKDEARAFHNTAEYVDDENEKLDDPLRTVHDLRVAILMYGNRPDYRRKGDDLYLRFVNEARAPKDERRIRPGFSPKRYITAWSRHWHEEMLQKMRSTGLVQDKTLYRQNPLLPHLYQPASYNLSSVPPPYRVTRNMLRTGDIGTYEFQRVPRPQPRLEAGHELKDRDFHVGGTKGGLPPSDNKATKEEQREPIPIGSIQAVRFLESGEVQEVKYSELKSQEKKEILAELLATAWEHGKHIEEMLDLVLATNKPRTNSAASSSAASELMMDMHRAILSLAESPVQRQIREKQQEVLLEKQRAKLEHEEAKRERKRQRKKKRAEREAQITKKASKREEEEGLQRSANKKAEKEEQQTKTENLQKQAHLKHEAELQEKQRRIESEGKEERRQARKDARKKKEEERAAKKKERQELAQKQEEIAKQQQQEEERLHMEEKRKREQRREERRRLREEKKQQKLQQEQQHQQQQQQHHHQARKVESHPAEPQEMPMKSHERKVAPLKRRDAQHPLGGIGTGDVHDIPGTEWDDGQYSQGSQAGEVVTNQSETVPKSRPMPSVPQNTPATQQRTVRVIQRQLPLENVIYEAKSKRSHASSSTTSSSKSRRGVPAHRPSGTVVSSGDGEFATYVPPTQTVVQQQKQGKRAKKLSPVQRIQPIALEPALSHGSTHSSKRNAVVFPADLLGDKSSGKSSFYGGAMPITSNIVKQTLSDKISILSASQDYSASGSAYGKSLSDRSGHPHQDHHNVPLIGVEPPTPIQADTSMGKHAPQIPLVPSPVPSASTRSGKLKKVPEKGSSKNLSNESDDEPYLSDHSNLSVSKSQKSEEGAVAFTKKSSTTLTGDSTSEAKYQVLKGIKGPGSQSSAATLSLKTGSKKSSSITRGSLPHALLKHKQAAIFMPDQKIVDVSTKGDLSSTTEQPTMTEESSSGQQESQTLPIKSSLKDASTSSSVKSDRRVSFQEETTSSEEEESGEEVEVSEVEESGKEDIEWPQVTQDLRPISSRSAKLTEHAKKIAQVVVSSQRPDSKLEEDATEAVKIWNKLASKSEDASSSEAESEETSEEDEKESSVGWDGNLIKEEEIIQKAEEEKKDREKEEKLAKKKVDKPATKEIVARKPAPAVAPSVKSFKSTSSGRTSISSIQEAFVKEVKRKASELGISEKELQFEPEIVDKVVNSTVDPEELEVFHDVESGKHVVRSRHSSITSKSYGTDNTDTTAGDETKAKQKYVIDMPKEVKAHSASPQPSASTTTSTTASPTSPSRFRALSQSSAKSSGTDQEVTLGYELTSYEGKLGDPKLEEPTVVARQKLEPERLDKAKSDRRESKVGQKAEKEDARKSKAKKPSKPLDDTSDIQQRESDHTTGSVGSGASLGKQGKSVDGKAQRKAGKKGKEKGKGVGATGKKQSEAQIATSAAASPMKPRPKTPEVPFVAGRAKDDKAPKGLQSPTSSVTPKPKKSKTGQPTQNPKTLVEMEGKSRKGKLSESSHVKDSEKKAEPETDDSEKPRPSSKTPVQEAPKSLPTKEEPVRTKSETPDGDLDQLSPIPAKSPEDDYEFVRVEESPAPSEPEQGIEEPAIDQPQEDAKSMASDQTAPTEVTEKTDDTDERMRAAEEEEARLAKKKDKDERRVAAAEKRRLEVERKRKEKEEQSKKEKEEHERQEALKEELENERRRRTEGMQRKREEAERERQRAQQEAELRMQREEQQREREKRLQEDHKKKMEELQKKKREEEARKAELARIKAEEEAQARKEEEELMAQMAEDERIEYERRKREEAEAKRLLEEERRIRQEEEARIAMEQARLHALIRAKQQAALEEKLRFARELFVEANGLDQTQNVNRAFSFSYFDILQLLGLDFADVNFEL